MAGGRGARGGSYDSGLVYTTRRTELPDPDVDFSDAHKAQRISSYADEDAHDISQQSRRKDRQLLNNITQKLQANNAYVPPVSHYRADYINDSYNHAPRRLSQPRVLPESVLFIRAGSLPPPAPARTRTYYYEDIEDSASLPPPTPRPTPRRFVKRRPVKRASSEPPLNFRPAPPPSQPLPISRTYIPEPYIFLGHGSSGSCGVKYVSPDPRNTNFTPSSLLAVRNARRHLDRIERELGVANAPSLDEPVIIHHVSTSPARVVHRPAARGAAVRTISQRVRSSSLPPAPRVAPRATGSRVGARRGSRAANIEARLAADQYVYSSPDPVIINSSKEPMSLSELRSKATEAKNKLDSHKVLMDRYLPVYFGPENDVQVEVDYKYGELVNRMPTLDKHRPTQGSIYSTPVAPYKPAKSQNKSVNLGPAPRQSFRPPVSDTRKRIREVLCATKRDPHYYD